MKNSFCDAFFCKNCNNFIKIPARNPSRILARPFLARSASPTEITSKPASVSAVWKAPSARSPVAMTTVSAGISIIFPFFYR